MTDISVSSAAVTPGCEQSCTDLGFLAILQDAGGVCGGYLVTNTWGRPIEFRLTTAIQPTKVQQVLYGPTLAEYVHGEVIGKTLVEKTAAQTCLVITDSLPALGLRAKLAVPVVALLPAGGTGEATADVLPLSHPRSSCPLVYSARFADDRPRIIAVLDRIDPAVDLAEPFTRVREAVAEARKSGGAGRVA